MSGEKTRKRMIFHGRVQGVGFRWHASGFARSKNLTGWVKNLDDGTVEMEVQGSEEKIDALVQYMEQRPHIWIEEIYARTIPLVEGETYFYSDEW